MVSHLYKFVLLAADDVSLPYTRRLAGMLEMYGFTQGEDFAVGRGTMTFFDDSEVFTKVEKTDEHNVETVESLKMQNVYVVKQFLPRAATYRRIRGLAERIRGEDSERGVRELIGAIHFGPSINDQAMALLQMIHTISKDSASVSVVAPYTPYMRSDRIDQSGVTAMAKLYAKLTEVAGRQKLQRYMTMRLHAAQEQQFFDVSCDDIPSKILFGWYIKNVRYKHMFEAGAQADQLVVASLDDGGRAEAQWLADYLKVPRVSFEKTRDIHSTKGGEAKVLRLNRGDVPLKDRIVLCLEDIVGTGGTVAGPRDRLLQEGASQMDFFPAHYIGCPKFKVEDPKSKVRRVEYFAEDKLFPPDLEGRFNVITTDSIPLEADYMDRYGVTQLSGIPLFGCDVRQIINGGSLSKLFSDKFDEVDEGLQNEIFSAAHSPGKLEIHKAQPLVAAAEPAAAHPPEP